MGFCSFKLAEWEFQYKAEKLLKANRKKRGCLKKSHMTDRVIHRQQTGFQSIIWLEGCRKWKQRQQVKAKKKIFKKKKPVELISVLGCVLCILMTYNHPHCLDCGLLKT